MRGSLQSVAVKDAANDETNRARTEKRREKRDVAINKKIPKNKRATKLGGITFYTEQQTPLHADAQVNSHIIALSEGIHPTLHPSDCNLYSTRMQERTRSRYHTYGI